MTVFDRIKSLAKKHSKTMKQVTIDLGYSENYFYSLKSGKQPSAEKLSEIADYFNVSVDYLLGRNQAPEWADKDDLIELDKLLESNVNMAYGGETLTPEEKQRVKDVMTGLFWEFRKRDKEK
ncbi:helix-turn-helix domain-containing protein [Enterococcus thailandicus]|uniref:helix-turn-helix domain-containing protein n=1 Tax=Enterococcus thailandicus TaxID=417368 RepID=UPI0035D6D5A5